MHHWLYISLVFINTTNNEKDSLSYFIPFYSMFIQ